MATSTTTEASAGIWGFIRNFHNKTILFRVGDWIFVTYGFIAATAFMVGYSTALWYNAMLGMDTASLAVFYLFFMIPMILMVSRITSILLEWRELFKKPLQTLVKPGYMLQGGVFGGMIAAWIYAHVTGSPLIPIIDALGFLMPLGEAICRLGCYVYGCCWGKPTESRFGVAYTSPHAKVVRCRPELHGVKIHPAQIYALTAHLIQFTIFYMLLPYKAFDGMFAALYLITHPMIRVILERFRQDDRGELKGGITHTNVYSAIQVVLGIGFLVVGMNLGQNLPVNMQARFLPTVMAPDVLPFVLGTWVVAAMAFGVHYKKVGSWMNQQSGGMDTMVDEMSMGAAARMKGHDAAE